MAGLLDGKSALITGGGGGIGRATALAFAREGARVAVADVSAEAARETVAQVNAAGGQAISLSGDVTRDADVRAMIDGVVGAYGRLDCAFNNAGIAGWQVEAAGKKTAEWSEEAFDRMIAAAAFISAAATNTACQPPVAVTSKLASGTRSEAVPLAV